jgi:hypothetical protein
MSKARDLANAGTALGAVDATELGYLDGVTSAVQTQVDAKIAKSLVTAKGDLIVATASGTVVAQPVGTNGQVLTANSAQADGVEWTTLTALPSQTGNTGKFLTTDGSAASWGNAVTGKNWKLYLGLSAGTVSGNPSPSGSTISAKMIYGSGTYAFVAGRYVWYSTDGKIWNYQLVGSATLYAIAVNPSGNWVVAGSANTVYSGSPGGTWTSRTTGISGTGDIYNVKWISSYSLFVMTGYANASPWTVISTSPTGVTWTGRYNHPSGSATYAVAIANNLSTTTVVGFDKSTASNGAYSTNGTTWTAVNINDSSNYNQSILWSPSAGRFFCTASNRHSQTPAAIGTAWSTTPTTYISGLNYDPINLNYNEAVLYEPQYDATTTQWYAIGSAVGFKNSALLVFEDTGQVTTSFTTGSTTNQQLRMSSAEQLPAITISANNITALVSYLNGNWFYYYTQNGVIHIWSTVV